MEEASEGSVFRTIGLLLFGLLALTGCAILALVMSVPSASAAESPETAAPPSISSPTAPQFVPSLLDGSLDQAQRALSATVDAVASPVRQTAATVLPHTSATVEHAVTAVVSGAIATVTRIVDTAPSVALPTAIESPLLEYAATAPADSTSATDAASVPATSARSTATVDLTKVELAEPATTLPEPPSRPGNDTPATPPATTPGPAPSGSSTDAPPAVLGERWGIVLAVGRASFESDAVPGSPSFGFDSTPD
ncbi:hypothetical protein [Parafrigoribacterium soli]|uniref:hypothetical protein n=1 Tax=Parafrigoribacterium soli TaxID=3144663 RepID=UPI0032EBDB77